MKMQIKRNFPMTLSELTDEMQTVSHCDFADRQVEITVNGKVVMGSVEISCQNDSGKVIIKIRGKKNAD